MTFAPRPADPRKVDLGYPRLYREELTAIAERVEGLCGGVAIELYGRTAEGQETLLGRGDAPDDFADPRIGVELLHRVVITGRSGSMEFRVVLAPGREGSRVVVANADAEWEDRARGAAEAIRELCLAHRRQAMSRSHTNRVTYWAMWAAGVVVIGLYIVEAAALGQVQEPAALMVGMAGLIGVMVALRFTVGNSALGAVGPLLFAVSREARPSHWQRHRVLYISNACTLLLAGAIGYLVNQIPGPG